MDKAFGLLCPCPTLQGHGWDTACAKQKRKKKKKEKKRLNAWNTLYLWISDLLPLLPVMRSPSAPASSSSSSSLYSRKVRPSFLDLFLFCNFSRFPICFVHVCLGQLLRSILHCNTREYLSHLPTHVNSLIYVSLSYPCPNFQKLLCRHIVPVLVSMQVLPS